jgi:hypothetical protein
MAKILAAASAALVLASASAANAGVYADDLSKCIVRSASSDDKFVLMNWIFFLFSLNPAVKPMTTITDTQRDEADHKMARLVERLLEVDCHKESVDALKYEGVSAITSSFRVFGEVASRELMNAPAVETEASKYASYIDNDKFNALLKEAGVATATEEKGKSPK